MGLRHRLLNFKLDSTSLRVFDGVDYTEEKKKREQQLKQLMYDEAAQQTRRSRKVSSHI